MITWWRNLQFVRSIKSQLWLIFVGLSIIPTVFLGILVYGHAATIQLQELDEKLSITAKDWAHVIQAHQDQIDKVLKREDALVKQKLVTLANNLLDELDLSRMLSSNAQLRDTSPVLQKIDQIAIGHSGFAFVLDRNGKYLASKGDQYTGQTIQAHLNDADKAKVAELLARPEILTAAGTYELRQKFQPESGGDYRDQLTILAYYAPSNVIVGVTSYYTDFQSNDYEQSLQQDVRDKLAEQVVGTMGNIWVLDSQGDYVVSRHRLQDNENIREYRDASGQPFIQNTIARAKTLKKGESFVIKYDWQEVGEKEPSARLASVTYMPEWDWVIGASTYYSDYQAGLQQLQLYIGLVCLVFVLLSSVGAYFFSMRITRPISKLQLLAVQAAAGRLDTPVNEVPHNTTSEIGSLSNSFNIMLQRLKGKINELNTEKAVAEGERAKDDAILSSIGDGMIVTDNVGNILLINAIATDLIGVDQSSAVGKKTHEVFDIHDDTDNSIPASNQPFQIALNTRKKTIQAVSYTTKEGAKISLSVTATPVIQQNATIGVIQIIRDVTKEKEVDRMKTEFISLASHQLRTPLSAIKWFSEMLASGDAGELKPEQTDFVKNITDSTQRMIDLVNSLLNISRMESGRIMIDPKPTDLKELIDSLAKELQVKTIERNQNLIISVHSDLPKINADPRLLRQVYLNLLTNAIKYTPKGGEISVFISRKGEEVISQVTDNGYGIPKSEQSKMFQKFFRATNITKVETDGTGLGMYLIKAIVEASHGKIWFESDEGKGTTFWFSMPLSGMQAKKGEVTIGD